MKNREAFDENGGESSMAGHSHFTAKHLGVCAGSFPEIVKADVRLEHLRLVRQEFRYVSEQQIR